MNKSLRKKLRKLKKKKVRLRIPIPPPGRRHRSKKDYKRVKRANHDQE